MSPSKQDVICNNAVFYVINFMKCNIVFVFCWDFVFKALFSSSSFFVVVIFSCN